MWGWVVGFVVMNNSARPTAAGYPYLHFTKGHKEVPPRQIGCPGQYRWSGYSLAAAGALASIHELPSLLCQLLKAFTLQWAGEVVNRSSGAK